MALPRLLLASTSPYKRELLQRLRLPFETVAPGLDEAAVRAASPAALATALARAKARAVAATIAHGLVIGADQIAVSDDRVLGKPGGFEAAVAQLRHAAGRAVEFFTAVCLIDAGSGRERDALARTVVHFRALDEAGIRRYVALDRPFDCAGSFRVEALGPVLFERVEGDDPGALVGLPLIAVARLLREAGVDVLAQTDAP